MTESDKKVTRYPSSELDAMPKLRPHDRHPARLDVAVVRVRPEDHDAEGV